MTQSYVEIRRSARRRRTVSARREGEKIVVLMPAGLSASEEREWIDRMVAKVERAGRPAARSDAQLLRRAQGLAAEFLDGRARPGSVRWVSNQGRRWGSCTPATAAIRLSDRLQGMPQDVIDYVLVHELAHLLEVHHNERFWALVARYPRSEYARGFLDGIARAAGWEPAPEGGDVVT